MRANSRNTTVVDRAALLRITLSCIKLSLLGFSAGAIAGGIGLVFSVLLLIEPIRPSDLGGIEAVAGAGAFFGGILGTLPFLLARAAADSKISLVLFFRSTIIVAAGTLILLCIISVRFSFPFIFMILWPSLLVVINGVRLRYYGPLRMRNVDLL